MEMFLTLTTKSYFEKKRWVFSHLGCIISGFVMYFVGIATVYIMVIISLERFYLTKDSSLIVNNKNERSSRIYRNIFVCLLFTFLWSAWSYFSMEGALTNCTIEWNDRSLNVISYNVISFFLFYLIPLVILVYTNFQLVRTVRYKYTFFLF
jgi:hypothetical protein